MIHLILLQLKVKELTNLIMKDSIIMQFKYF